MDLSYSWYWSKWLVFIACILCTGNLQFSIAQTSAPPSTGSITTSEPATGCNITTQCFLNQTLLEPLLNCSVAIFGETDPPCYGHWSSASSCSCNDPNYRISSIGATYFCNDDGTWDTELYDLQCLAPCITDADEKAIPRNSDGNVTTIIKDSDYVTYTCPEGYTGSGTQRVDCNDGIWEEHEQYTCTEILIDVTTSLPTSNTGAAATTVRNTDATPLGFTVSNGIIQSSESTTGTFSGNTKTMSSSTNSQTQSLTSQSRESTTDGSTTANNPTTTANSFTTVYTAKATGPMTTLASSTNSQSQSLTSPSRESTTDGSTTANNTTTSANSATKVYTVNATEPMTTLEPVTNVLAENITTLNAETDPVADGLTTINGTMKPTYSTTEFLAFNATPISTVDPSTSQLGKNPTSYSNTDSTHASLTTSNVTTKSTDSTTELFTFIATPISTVDPLTSQRGGNFTTPHSNTDSTQAGLTTSNGTTMSHRTTELFTFNATPISTLEPVTNYVGENFTTPNSYTDSTQAGLTTSNGTTKSADSTTDNFTFNATPISTVDPLTSFPTENLKTTNFTTELTTSDSTRAKLTTQSAESTSELFTSNTTSISTVEPVTNYVGENFTTSNSNTDSTQAGLTTSNGTTKSDESTTELFTFNATPISTLDPLTSYPPENLTTTNFKTELTTNGSTAAKLTTPSAESTSELFTSNTTSISTTEPLTNIPPENSTTAYFKTDSTEADVTTSNGTTKLADITSELLTLNATPISTVEPLTNFLPENLTTMNMKTDFTSNGLTTTNTTTKSGDSTTEASTLNATTIPPVDCNMRFNSTGSNFTSPGYPNEYGYNLECIYEATALDAIIELSFTSFSIYMTDLCSAHYVSVYDGGTSQVIAKFCGDDLPFPVYSTENTMAVTFKTDSEGDFSYQGFQATFSFIDISMIPSMVSCDIPDNAFIDGYDESEPVRNGHTAVLECFHGYSPSTGKTAIHQCANGTFVPPLSCNLDCNEYFNTSLSMFASPGFPLQYDNYLDCFYRTETSSGYVVMLTFLEIDVEQHETCRYDYVSVYDGGTEDAEQISKICGEYIPLPMYSTGKDMLVVFTTDYDRTRRGFEAMFTFVNESSIPLGEPCFLPTDAHYFTNNEEPLQHRRTAFIKCNDGFLPPEPVNLQCSNGTFQPYLSCNSSGCTNFFNTSPSYFTSPSYPSYNEYLTCFYTAEAPTGNVVSLRFISFKMNSDMLCRKDFVSVYDGNTTQGVPIAKFCGNVIPETVYSTKNTMVVTITTDAYAQGGEVGFEAYFTFISNMFIPNTENCHPPQNGSFIGNTGGDVPHGHTVVVECDPGFLPGGQAIRQCVNGTLYPVPDCNSTGCLEHYTSTPSFFSSVGSPRYEIYLMCSYSAESPPGFIIELTFTDFSVYKYEMCEWDVVSVFDGISTEDDQLATFCGSNVPCSLYSTGNKMLITFKTDYYTYSVETGFRGTIVFLENSTVPYNDICYAPAFAHFVNEASESVPHGHTAILECDEGFLPTKAVLLQCCNGTFTPSFTCKSEFTTVALTTSVTTESATSSIMSTSHTTVAGTTSSEATTSDPTTDSMSSTRGTTVLESTTSLDTTELTTAVTTIPAETTFIQSTTSLHTTPPATAATTIQDTTTIETTVPEEATTLRTTTSFDPTTSLTTSDTTFAPEITTSKLTTLHRTTQLKTTTQKSSTLALTTEAYYTTSAETTTQKDGTSTERTTPYGTTTKDVTTRFQWETTLPTTVVTPIEFFLRRRYILPHLTSNLEPVIYNLGFMDTDLANTTLVRVQTPTEKNLGDFYGGVINTFQYSLPEEFGQTRERSTLEVQSTGDVHLFISTTNFTNPFLGYPLDWLGTDYLIGTSPPNPPSSFIVTATEVDTKLSVFFPHDFVLDDVTYNFEKDLRRTLFQLQSFSITTPFDPSGTYIKASKPVAVMMELRLEDRNELKSCSSSFYVPPISSWGTSYSFASSSNSNISFSITAAYNYTMVTVTPHPVSCGDGENNLMLDSWSKTDFSSYIGCRIEVVSNQSVLVLMTEYSNDNICNTMVVPSKETAVKSTPGVPVFVSAVPAGSNLKVWISNEDYQSLQVDGGQTHTWEVIGEVSQTGTIVETLVEQGYHVVSSTNEKSRLLITINKKLYAAHEESKEGTTMCQFDRLYFSGVELTFQATPPGSTAQSIEVCETSSSSNIPLASRNCGPNSWEEPVLVECYSSSDVPTELERIANTTVTEENVDQIASEVALLTSQTEDLSPTEVDNAADSLVAIVETGSTSPDVTDSVVGTVNNLMELEEATLAQAGETTTVIVSLEQQVSNVQQNPDNFTEVEDNVGVRAVKIDPSITEAITFANLSPRKGNNNGNFYSDLTENNTVLFNDEEEVQDENSVSSIYLPPKILQLAEEADPDNIKLPFSFLIYKDSRLFQTSMPEEIEEDGMTIREDIFSQVISAKVEIQDLVIDDLSPEDAIIARFTTANVVGDNDIILNRTCVFWVTGEDAGTGNWSDDGCHTSTTLSNDLNETVCNCTHLTSFAVIFRLGHTELKESESLDLITIIGSSLSVAGLTACVFTLTLIKKLRVKQPTKIHINLCLCLIGFYVSFLSGDLAINKEPHCRNLATATHYFCLATIAWTCTEAVNMYLLFVKYSRSNNIKFFVPVSFTLCYGLPLIPTLLVYFLDEPRELEDYCFLHPGKSLYYGLLLEILIMIMFNIIVFTMVVRIVVFRPMLSTNAQNNRREEVIARIQQFVLFWVLLGLSWTFGFLVAIPNRKTIAIEVLFCIFTSLQGFVLFFFICVKNPEIKKAFQKTAKRRFTRKEGYQMKDLPGSKSMLSESKTDPKLQRMTSSKRHLVLETENTGLSSSELTNTHSTFTGMDLSEGEALVSEERKQADYRTMNNDQDLTKMDKLEIGQSEVTENGTLESRGKSDGVEHSYRDYREENGSF